MEHAEPSGAMNALHVVCATIRRRHPDVPDILVPLRASTETVSLGCAAAEGQSDRVDLLTEPPVSVHGAAKPAESVLAGLLHEATHGLARARGIKDTSRRGRYHNSWFAVLSEELGLSSAPEPTVGWSRTRLRPETVSAYAAELRTLGAALRSGDTVGREQGSTSDDAKANHRRLNTHLLLACACGRTISGAPTSVKAGAILCGVCDKPFRPTTYGRRQVSTRSMTHAGVAGGLRCAIDEAV